MGTGRVRRQARIDIRATAHQLDKSCRWAQKFKYQIVERLTAEDPKTNSTNFVWQLPASL